MRFNGDDPCDRTSKPIRRRTRQAASALAVILACALASASAFAEPPTNPGPPRTHTPPGATRRPEPARPESTRTLPHFTHTPRPVRTPVDPTPTSTFPPTETATPTGVPAIDGLQPDFAADVTQGTSPLAVNFTDLSSGSIESWLWDFGDGDTSTEQNPTHVYSFGGAFTVSLTITSPSDLATETKVDFVVVQGGGGIN